MKKIVFGFLLGWLAYGVALELEKERVQKENDAKSE